MPYEQYALVKHGFVFNIVIFDSPTEEFLAAYKLENDLSDVVKSAKNCTIGAIWDGESFTPPRPYDSWVWDSESESWVSPIPYPTPETLADITKEWSWNESDLRWDLREG
jgi:hypothetical protein